MDSASTNGFSIHSLNGIAGVSWIFEHYKCKSGWISSDPDIPQLPIIAKCLFEFVPGGPVAEFADINLAI